MHISCLTTQISVSFKEHEPIKPELIRNGDVLLLSWVPPQDCPVKEYDVMRKKTKSYLEKIGVVSNNEQSYTINSKKYKWKIRTVTEDDVKMCVDGELLWEKVLRRTCQYRNTNITQHIHTGFPNIHIHNTFSETLVTWILCSIIRCFFLRRPLKMYALLCERQCSNTVHFYFYHWLCRSV